MLQQLDTHQRTQEVSLRAPIGVEGLRSELQEGTQRVLEGKKEIQELDLELAEAHLKPNRSSYKEVDNIYKRDQEARGEGKGHQEMGKADTQNLAALKKFTAEEVRNFPDATKKQLAVVIAHIVSPVIDAPKEGYKRFAELATLIKELWKQHVDFGSGVFGHNILNRLSGAVRFALKASIFVSYEGEIGEDHLEYLTGERLPLKVAQPYDYSDLPTLLTKIKKDYARTVN